MRQTAEAVTKLRAAVLDVAELYAGLNPDGRELGGQSVDTVECLERSAKTSLLLDSGRHLVEGIHSRMLPIYEALKDSEA